MMAGDHGSRMRAKTYCSQLPLRLVWMVERGWYRLRLRWYTADKAAWVVVLAIALIFSMFGLFLRTTVAHRDDRRNLFCLARNVYFEARGEPMAGQYAVAEVTMNRMASGRYPATVCGVVYQQSWDPLRKRLVGAFSWTEFDELSPPAGEEWRRAWTAADAVYYRREAPVLEGALFYHATHVTPHWARGKQPLARIGRHVFYR
jgi:N-acetylmuramoyl-L-alanine amidase